MASSSRRSSPVRLVGLAALVAVLVAMVLNTKFLTPEELSAALPKPFDPAETGKELFDQAKSELPGTAAPLSEVLAAVQSDPEAAAEQYDPTTPSEDTYIFAVNGTATVSKVRPGFLELNVKGAGQTPVLLPLTTAINGTVLRDAMGFRFADAPGQTEFQFVGDELKKLMTAEVGAGIKDPSSVEGKQVELLGVMSITSVGGAPPPKAKPVNVQPITLEAAS